MPPAEYAESCLNEGTALQLAPHLARGPWKRHASRNESLWLAAAPSANFNLGSILVRAASRALQCKSDPYKSAAATFSTVVGLMLRKAMIDAKD